ncbi:MAG: Flp pilus assembly complex ATPase component TadA [Magnetococcales bacterium]|nr:Flp pilus assembly complex ATPase component TadA [Magnetococcales bacterium]
MLLNADIITQDKLTIALTEQKKTGEQLGRIIVKLGFVPEQVMRDVLSSALGQPSIDLDKARLDPTILAMVPKKLIERHKVLPVHWDPQKSELTVAMTDTQDVAVIDKIQAQIHSGITIKTVLAGQSEIARAIQKHFGGEISLEGVIHELETGSIDLESITDQSGQFSHPMVRLVDMLLSDAVHRDASDIHIEPELGFVRIRYRIDGVLSDVRNLHRDYLSGLVVRIKVLAGMNIAETRAPQDGRFSMTISMRAIDFRVSSQPTTHGENLVLRVLDRNKGIRRLEELGLSKQTLTILKLMMAKPEGIILVTGPTGSGKTTTLYSMLNFLNTEQVNIMTLEDPVEYPLPMVRQTAVNPAANLDFANGVRSMLRQDPDIILVGEIRDKETAQMALRAAMTGHQVYSTLHTNSALGVFPRLLDIGVSAEILSGNIIGLLSQRLVRVLCRHCKRPYLPNALERRLLGLTPEQPCEIFTAVGCDHCQGVGFKGRMTVMEVIRMDEDFDALIERGAPKTAILQLARKKGFLSIAEDGIRRVLDGSSSLDEITRVLDLSKRLEK